MLKRRANMESLINTKIELRHDAKFYSHRTWDETVFVYIGHALKSDPQISLHADGSVSINASHSTDEKAAQMIRKVIKSAGGTADSKTWWGGKDDEVVKRKKDATRYTQRVEIEHGTTTIKITLFVDLA
jgi:hypothetical protein